MYRSLQPGAVGIHATLEEGLELAAQYGFGGLHVSIQDVVQIGLEKVKAQFEAKGLIPSAWGLPVGVRGDEATFNEGLKSLPGLADAAQKLGCLRTSTFILSFSDDLPFKENYQQHQRRLKAIGEILRDRDIRLGLEFLGPKTLRDGHPHAFIHTMDGMLQLCDDIGTGNLGLLLDAWHWYTSHGTVEDLRQLRDEHIVDVHVNDAPKGIPVDEQIDNIRCLPGETGVIDMAGFLGALQAIGYTGPIMSEPFSKKTQGLSPQEAARITAETLEKIWRIAGLDVG